MHDINININIKIISIRVICGMWCKVYCITLLLLLLLLLLDCYYLSFDGTKQKKQLNYDIFMNIVGYNYTMNTKIILN